MSNKQQGYLSCLVSFSLIKDNQPFPNYFDCNIGQNKNEANLNCSVYLFIERNSPKYLNTWENTGPGRHKRRVLY